MDVDAVLDYYIAQGLDRDPYWCRAWPSAICLAQQLLHRPELVKGARHTESRCAPPPQLSCVGQPAAVIKYAMRPLQSNAQVSAADVLGLVCYV